MRQLLLLNRLLYRSPKRGEVGPFGLLLGGLEVRNVGLVALGTRLAPPFSRQRVVVVDLTELTLDFGVPVHGLLAAAGAVRRVGTVDADGLFILLAVGVAVSAGAFLAAERAFQAEEAGFCFGRGRGFCGC